MLEFVCFIFIYYYHHEGVSKIVNFGILAICFSLGANQNCPKKLQFVPENWKLETPWNEIFPV